MAMPSCRHFSGYKPCRYSSGSDDLCNASCSKMEEIQSSILIVHLGALGAVARSTSLLPAIHRKHPRAKITWITDAPAHHLLSGNPSIDRVLVSDSSGLLELKALHFDAVYCIDKSLKAAGIVSQTSYEKLYGFRADLKTGSILPATAAAQELWQLGIDNPKKFFDNLKPETQLMVEALELGSFERDEYLIPLSSHELRTAEDRRSHWGQSGSLILGINTGSSSVIPMKKWTVEYHRALIEVLIQKGYQNIVLLGGPEDAERNEQIGKNLPVIQSPTRSGLRDGLCSVKACDIVLSGDSLGMHLAIAMKKFVVAWFGPTCAHEIDLYDRGVALIADVSCGPCWKRSCQKDVMCYDQVSISEVINAIEQGVSWIQKLPSKTLGNSPVKKPLLEPNP